MAAAFEWEDSAEDRISFDSDPFEEDSMSLCSWVSENEADRGLTWRGWKKTASSGHERSLVQEPETDCGDVSLQHTLYLYLRRKITEGVMQDREDQ